MYNPRMFNFAKDPVVDAQERHRQALAFDEMVQSSGLGSALGSREQRAAYIRGLNGQAFVDLLSSMHRVIVNLPDDDPSITPYLSGAYDREHNLTTDLYPAPEDKEVLLHKVLETAQELEDPADQAVVMGFGINVVHPFYDGNGRMARAAYALFSRDYKPKDEKLLSALQANGDKVFLLDANLYTPVVYQVLKAKIGSHYPDINGFLSIPKVEPWIKNENFEAVPRITTRREYDADKYDEILGLFADQNVGPILSYLLVKGTTFRSVRDATVKGKYAVGFCFDEFLINASDNEIDKAYDLFRHIKRQYVDTFLALLVDKENSGIHIVHPDGSGVSSALGLGRLAASGAFKSFGFTQQ